MEIAQTLPLLPGDPRLIDHIICLLKSQGLFDQFRKECISDVDTKPAYQNLRQRVEGSVAGFLTHQKWKPDLNKNQLREKLRKHILDSKFLDQGVERIVDQVVNPKISSVFIPQVEEVVYKCFGLEKPNRPNTSHLDEPYESTSSLQLSTGDLLPNDLEAVSPDSEKSQNSPSELKVLLDADVALKKEDDCDLVCQTDDNMLKVETVPIKTDTPYDSDDSDTSKDEEFESPAFEPIGGGFKQENSPNNSHLSGMSDFTSHDSSDSSNDKEKMVISSAKLETLNTDSQLSQVSSDSNLFNDAHARSATVSTFDNKFNISTGDDKTKVMKIDSSDASNTPCYKLSNDDNSSDARQSFENSDKKMEVVNQESDVFEDSVDGIFTKNTAVARSGSDIVKSISSSEVADAVSHHRSSIESKTSTESIKDTTNIDMSVDSNESKSSNVSVEKEKKSGSFNFETKESFSFENRLTAQDNSMDGDDSSSNDLKIDLQAAVSEEVDDSSSNGLKMDLSRAVQSDGEIAQTEVKEGVLQDIDMKVKSPKDEVSDRYKSRSKESDRKSSVSHSHSKDYHKDRRDDSKHQSKTSRHSSSGRHDSERKHSSSSSRDRKDSSHSKISLKDSQTVEKDRHSKSSNGESSKRDHHSSGHRSSTSHRHSSSSSKHHSSSSRHHYDDPSKSRHSSTSDKHSSDKTDKTSQRNNETSNSKNTSTKDTSGHGSSHRDRKHSTSQDESRRRTLSSNSTGDKKSDEKKSKRKSSKDDHYSSSGRGGKSRRSSDRDSNDGNNGSLSRSHSHSASSSGVHNNTSNKSNSKSSNSGTDNGSSGNSSSGGQSNSLSETLNITKGSYIKSEFNMFQPIVKKPTLAELHMLSRSPEAVAKKPVIHVDSQLNPVKVEEKLIEPPAVAIEIPTIRKPRFASNIFEARKLMKVRKQIEKMERKKQQEAIKLLEEQQNVPKSESQVFSGLSGPELEFACIKGYGNTSAVKESRTHQSFPINRKDCAEDVPDLLYFDNNPKSKSQIDYERASKCLKQYLTLYNGVSKKQTVIHLIKCDSGLEQAFKRLSTKDHKIKTVNLHQNGAVITSAPFKRVKKSHAKSQSESISDLIIPDNLQFGKMISNFVFDNTNKYLNEEPFVKIEKMSNKMLNKIKTASKVQKKQNSIMGETNTADECYNNDIYDINAFNSSYDYGNDYGEEFDDSVLQASKQDIMEIILGSGVNFDSTIVDLKRLQHLNSDVSSASELKSNMDVCNGKMLTVEVHSMDTVPLKRRKRNVSVHFEDEVNIHQSKVNHNNNFKADCVTPKKRKMMEKTLQESSTYVTLCTTDRKESVAPTNTLSPKGNKPLTKGLSLGKVRRIGLSKPKRTSTGLSKSKIMKSTLDIPCSPESDKSVENHINHNTSVKNFINRTVIGVDGSNESVAINQNTQQMVKSIVRGCLGDVYKSKFIEQGQRKIAAGFKRSDH